MKLKERTLYFGSLFQKNVIFETCQKYVTSESLLIEEKA